MMMENTKDNNQINPLDIETVTPDTENEKLSSDQHAQHESKAAVEREVEQDNSQEKPVSETKDDAEKAPDTGHYEEAKHEPLPGRQVAEDKAEETESENNEDDEVDTDENKSDDPGDEIETVSP